jgi:hypothetical protein
MIIIEGDTPPHPTPVLAAVDIPRPVRRALVRLVDDPPLDPEWEEWAADQLGIHQPMGDGESRAPATTGH